MCCGTYIHCRFCLLMVVLWGLWDGGVIPKQKECVSKQLHVWYGVGRCVFYSVLRAHMCQLSLQMQWHVVGLVRMDLEEACFATNPLY